MEIPASGAHGSIAVARYRAQDDRLVIVKVSKAGNLNRPRLLGRARDEARMMFMLRHPNVVHVEELVEVAGRPVLIMEWVEGVSLRAMLEAHGALPLRVVLEIVRGTCSALDAAWSTEVDGRPLRIVHRDIKPSNLLLSIRGELKVVDFGIATGEFDDREISTLATVLGTQGYIAPERLEGVADSPALDVYSVGVTAAELLTADPAELAVSPERHALVAAKVRQSLLDRVPGPNGVRVADLVERLRAWAAAERPSAAEVLVEVDAFLADLGDDGPSLPALAAEVVAPLFAARPRVPPQDHADWKELEFLEDPWVEAERLPQSHENEIPTTVAVSDSVADRRVRQFLAQADWSSRVRELTWLLANNAGWSELPFLEILDAADTPWWRMWTRRTTPAEVVASLHMLRYRRTARVLDRARALVASDNAAVAQAARSLIGEGGHDS